MRGPGLFLFRATGYEQGGFTKGCFMAKELTGKHVLMITVGAFSVIIAVNIFMAYSAIGTFPGLEVENSYVASQSFDKDRAAQEALGWSAEPVYENGTLSLVMRDAAGLPAPVSDLTALVGRTTYAGEDISPEFLYKGGVFVAPVDLAPGAWLIHLEAKAADGTVFRKRMDLFIEG